MKKCLNNKIFLPCHCSVKWSDPGAFLNAQFVIFKCQKYVKKGYMEMTKIIYLEPLKSVLGCFILHYFGHPNCVRIKSIKQCPNRFRIVSWNRNYIPLCFSVAFACGKLFTSIVLYRYGYNAERSFTPITLSNVNLCSMTFYFRRKLPIKFPLKSWRIKIHSLKHHNKKPFCI